MPRSRIFRFALLMLAALYAPARQVAQVVATLAVNGAETSQAGVPDAGNISVSFNGFIEIVNYAEYSTSASLASGLAAQFSRDYYGYGLRAKAGYSSTGVFNQATANVITFWLPAPQSFGSIDYTLPNTSFSLVPSGFAPNTSTLADTGTVTLTVGNPPVILAMANYGDGTNPAMIARALQDSASPQASVSVLAVGDSLYLAALQAAAAGDLPYAIRVTHDTADFPNPSFEFTPMSGQLAGGAAASPGSQTPLYWFSILSPGGVSGYAANGNLLYLQDSVMGSWAYSYDPLNRLTGASHIGGTQLTGSYTNPSLCWSYDLAGNRLAQALATQPFSSPSCQLPAGASGTQALATYIGESSGSTNNRMAAITPAGQSTAASVTYDGNGNITNDGVNSYLYDLEDRLCAVHGAYGMIGYQYDAEGHRIGKGSITAMSCDITVNGYQPQTEYILDQAGDQVTELAINAIGTEVWQHTNVWADGQLISTYDTTGQHFYFNDPLGTRRYQTDAAGVFEQSCQSLPFGDSLNCSLSSTAPTEHHFTGKERDLESGLDFFMARYYASSVGRFMSPDWSAKKEPVPYAKLDNTQSLNLYAYVGNNPLSRVDPDGHACTAWYGNSGWTGSSGFCNRAAEYAKFDADPAIRSRTRFFGAAATVSNALGDVDAWRPGTLITGVSNQTRGFLEGVGRTLRAFNEGESHLVATGALGSGPALDRELVHNEQTVVQGALDGLKSSDLGAYNKTIGEINGSLNGLLSKALQQVAPSDRAYAAVLKGVTKDLGHSINFANQGDREAIGNALAQNLRNQQH